MKIKTFLIVIILACNNCSPSTYEELESVIELEDVITYENDVKPIIQSNCITCHSTGNSASFRLLTSYSLVKESVLNTDLLERIQKQNGETGLMPQTGRMPQTEINLILKWVNDGLLE